MSKALEILNRIYPQEDGYFVDATKPMLDEAIAELEEAMKPKTCEGCKFQEVKEKAFSSYGSWAKWSVFYKCINTEPCGRNIKDMYEPKDNA